MSATRKVRLGLASLLVWAMAAQAEPLVDLNFAELTLGQAAATLSQLDGVTVTVDAAVSTRQLGLAVEQLPLTVALELVAEAGGLVLTSPRAGSYHLAPTAPGTAPATVWTPLKRGEVIKDVLTPQRLAPATLAGYFGRPGLTQVNGRTSLQQPAQVLPTLLACWLPDEPTQAAAAASARARLGARLTAELQARWSAPDRPGAEAEPFLRLPHGVRAVIGFDPAGKLIVVGEPTAVERFHRLVASFDVAPGEVTVASHLLRLAPGELDGLGLTWTRQETWDPAGQAKAARLPAADLTALLARLEAGRRAEGPELALSSSRPLVLSLAAATVLAGGQDGCAGLPPAWAAEVEAVVASLDLRLMAWPQPDGRVELLVDPVQGVATAGLRQVGQKAELTQTAPGVAGLYALQPGEALILREYTPGEASSAPCSLLGELPLVGSLFNPANPAERGWEAALVLVPAS